MKKDDFIIMVFLFLFYLGLIFVSIFLTISIEKIYYWYLAVAWIIIIWKLKLSSGFSMIFALILFISGALITLIGFNDQAEIIMRICVTGFIIGVMQAFFEFRRNINK